jgi:hypothetical protein
MFSHAQEIYKPYKTGVYDLGPSLLRFQWSPQEHQKRFFQIDHQYEEYVENKIACRKEKLSKYVQEKDLNENVREGVAQWMQTVLTEEYGTSFLALKKKLSSQASLKFRDDLDLLCSCVPEDLAIVSCDSQKEANQVRRNWISYLHLCSPGHWAAEDKIGLDFTQTHAPVPGIEKMLAKSEGLIEGMIFKGPFERFVWGFSNQKRLNLHPHDVQRPLFIPSKDEVFYLRVERQVMKGFPELCSFAFLIRCYFYDLREIRHCAEDKNLLIQALSSMSDASRSYKGLGNCYDDLLKWLE